MSDLQPWRTRLPSKTSLPLGSLQEKGIERPNHMTLQSPFPISPLRYGNEIRHKLTFSPLDPLGPVSPLGPGGP